MKIIRTLIFCFIVISVAACSASRPSIETDSTKIQIDDVVSDGDEVFIKKAYDPWHGYNHWMYNFNAKFDRYIFIPTVNAYRAVTPEFARKGIHNVFKNLGEVSNFANSVLQAKPVQSGRTLGRFLVNSTIGIAGLWDPASTMGLHYQKEDFGQTLGRWGAGPGPYFVLPILGPSTLRDAPGGIVDRIFHPIYEPYPWLVDIKSEEALAISVVNAIDTRANIGFRYYEMGSPFEYYWVRSLWLEYRKLEIEK